MTILSFQLELLASLSTPHVEDVEVERCSSGWTLENPDAGITWTTAALGERARLWSDHGLAAGSLYLPTNGELDHRISPVFDLTGSMNSRLLFDHAYVEYSATYTDGFRVEVSRLQAVNGWSCSTSPVPTRHRTGRDRHRRPVPNGARAWWTSAPLMARRCSCDSFP